MKSFMKGILWKRSRRAKGTCSNSGLQFFFLVGQVHTMNFIHQSLSLTIPTPRSYEPENFSSLFFHLKLKWSKLTLKTLLFTLLFISSFSLPLAFTILCAKSSASAWSFLIYTGLSKTHIGSFLSLKMLPMRCVRIMTQENEVID